MQDDFEDFFSDGGKSPRAIEQSGGRYCLMQATSAWHIWRAASSIQSSEIARLTAELAQAQNGAQMYEYVRTLNPQQFGQLFGANISGNGRFDDLVQVAMLAAAPKPPGAA